MLLTEKSQSRKVEGMMNSEPDTFKLSMCEIEISHELYENILRKPTH